MTMSNKRVFNEAQLIKYAEDLAGDLQPGAVIALVGDLGTGKTTFTKALASGLGVSEPVQSPTFTFIKEYKSGRLPLYHFDVYRLGSEEELEDLGMDEYLFGDGVSVVEWADKFPGIFPEGTLVIELAYSDGEDLRDVSIRDCGSWDFAQDDGGVK
jgi:tRNA threonylcarbamoyladenosine biosynthesis protein TsaE